MAEKEYIERSKIFEFPIRANHCDKENANEHFINGVESVMEYVETIPCADVAPVVRGRWVIDAKNHSSCSQCLFWRNIETQIGWNYCQNCGAKMDGGDK